MIKCICVYGAGSMDLDKEYYDAAFELGAKAAVKGWSVVYGGGKSGVMGYTAKGVIYENGELTGVAPKFMLHRGVLFEDCTRLILTKDMRERKQRMDEMADAFVVMPGGFGTLEEFFEILTEKTLGLHSKPIVLVNIRGIWDSLAKVASDMLKEQFTNQECVDAFKIVNTVDEALDFVSKDSETLMSPRWMKYVAGDEK